MSRPKRLQRFSTTSRTNLLIQAQENGSSFWMKHIAFLAGEQVPNIDEDGDEFQTRIIWHSMWITFLNLMNVDAFDSDVD
ncbi:hypothetical protein Tco_0607987 [Tanacetum coccineum]